MKRLTALVAAIGIAAMSCSAEPAAPAMEPDQQGELTAQAIAHVCTGTCTANPVYVRDQLVDINTLAVDEEPMPVEVSEAIRNAYPEAVFVDGEEANEVIATVDAGEAVMVNVADVAQLAPEVVGIDIGISFIAFRGQTVQFMWDGSDWLLADSQDTGVTVTSSVS
jgi:hypothetical protein